MIRYAGLFLGTYMVAAVPFGYLIGRAGGVDVRRRGSGNIGATNLLRTRGKVAGILTLLLDAAKGAVPVTAAHALFPAEPWVPVAAGFVAVAGHCFSLYMRFHGGKGVATAVGAFLALDPLVAAGAVSVFTLVVAWTRLVALGSTIFASALPGIAWLLGTPELALGSIPIAIVIVWRHRENLARIRSGTEDRLGSRRATGEGP